MESSASTCGAPGSDAHRCSFRFGDIASVNCQRTWRVPLLALACARTAVAAGAGAGAGAGSVARSKAIKRMRDAGCVGGMGGGVTAGPVLAGVAQGTRASKRVATISLVVCVPPRYRNVHEEREAGRWPWKASAPGVCSADLLVYDFAKFRALASVLSTCVACCTTERACTARRRVLHYIARRAVARRPRSVAVNGASAPTHKLGMCQNCKVQWTDAAAQHADADGESGEGGSGDSSTCACQCRQRRTAFHGAGSVSVLRDTVQSTLPFQLTVVVVLHSYVWPAPDTVWNHKLMHLVAVYSSLISANAFVSTLGGGHFLCKQIDSSRRMAERQIDIARRLGDTGLMLRCSVHLVYNDIQAGDFESAYVRVQDLREAAVEREDEELLNMLVAAETYLHKVAALYGVRVSAGSGVGSGAGTGAGAGAAATGGATSAAHQPLAATGLRPQIPEPSHPLFDDFYRQRLAPQAAVRRS